MEDNKEELSRPPLAAFGKQFKIEYPLTDDEILTLNNSYILSGEVQLSGGSAVVQDNRISPIDRGWAIHKSFSGTPGILRVECQTGSVSIFSSSSTDNSVVIWFVKQEI